ncbi:putative uncharacterized protein [Methylocaldum marinum]|uniref:Uncharacterized protein n=1 Tax=Methylocaldum marinum TaxID=1432792 RepID=A0A250KR51_9GAMM|nr:putative uncharacterized protein [Methylocaldum marinum]
MILGGVAGPVIIRIGILTGKINSNREPKRYSGTLPDLEKGHAIRLREDLDPPAHPTHTYATALRLRFRLVTNKHGPD